MIRRRRSLVAPLAATLVAGLLAMIPGTPAVLAAAKNTVPRLVKQTETSDTFANGDGTYTALFYAGPVNFFDKTTNQWRKLDKQFRPVGDHVENGAGPAHVQLPVDSGAADGITVTKDDWSASFTFADATSNRPATIANGHVRYDAVAAGVSLDYRMLSNGLKEDVIVDRPLPADWSGRFRFRLAVKGATPMAVENGTAVSFQDGAGHELGRIPQGTMVDANGAKGVVDMHLVDQNGSWFVDVVPDPGFLRAADRAYPVSVDPSIIYSPQSPTDSFTDSVCTTCNYNGLDFLKAGWANAIPGTAEYYSYLRFPDLTPILGKGVTNAQLRVEATYENDPSNYGLLALRTHGSWNASTITWANMAGHGPEQYRINKGLQGGPDYYFDITSWAQGWAAGQDGEWLNGKWSPYGATINTGGAAAYYELGAAESTFVPNIPSMSVTYTNQSPNVPPAASLSPTDGWTGTSAPTLVAGFSDPDDSNGWIDFQIDGGAIATIPTVNGSASYPAPVSSGTHSWIARGKDVDSTGPWTAVRYFTINNKPSVDPLSLSPADGYYNTTLPALSARYLDPDNNSGSLTFEVDGVPYSVAGIANGATGSCTTANLCLPSSLAPGLHSWRVQAVDSLGLPSDWSPYQEFEYHYAGQVVRDEYPVNGNQWDTTKWATSSGLTVSNNQGVFPAATASKRATVTGAYLQDSDVSFTYSIPDRSAGTELRTMLRGYGATGSAQLPNGYRLDIPSGLNADGSTTMSLKKLVNGVVTPLGSSFSYTGSGYASTRVRFRVEGSTISVKVWPAGTLEPTAWSVQRTDTAITAAGTLQIAQSYQTGTGRVINVDNVTYQNRAAWGVDSVTQVDQSTFNQVQNTYGAKPDYWGRYLHDDENPHPLTDIRGLNRRNPNEVSFLAANHMPVWVIDYNPKDDTLETEAKGRHAADLAIAHAGPPSQLHPDALSIPKTVAIFADVEPLGLATVDKDWIWGWFDEINNAGWKVGFYANPRTDNNFIAPFCQAVGLHTEMLTKTYLWSQQPETYRTHEATAPTYKPDDFNCDVYGVLPSLGWQYGLGGDHPAQGENLPTPDLADTDLIRYEMADVLWYPGGVSCPAPRGATCSPQ